MQSIDFEIPLQVRSFLVRTASCSWLVSDSDDQLYHTCPKFDQSQIVTSTWTRSDYFHRLMLTRVVGFSDQYQ